MIINRKRSLGTEGLVKPGNLGLFASDDDNFYIKRSDGTTVLIGSGSTSSNGLFEGEYNFFIFAPDFSTHDWETPLTSTINDLSGGSLTGLDAKGILVEGSFSLDSDDLGLTAGSPFQIKTFVFQGAVDGGVFSGETDIQISISSSYEQIIDLDNLLGYGTASVVAQSYTQKTFDFEVQYIYDRINYFNEPEVHNVRLKGIEFETYFNEFVLLSDELGNLQSVRPPISFENIGSTLNTTITNTLPIYSTHSDADNDADLDSGSLYKLTADRTIYQKD